MTIDPKTFRNGLRNWASGVTIVSTRVSNRIDDVKLHGMTVSAFSSVSADPPLVLVCCNRESETTSFVRQSGKFTINLLSSEQEALSSRFAFDKVADRFSGIPHQTNEYGALFPKSLAALSCSVRMAYEEGSHTVFVASVDDLIVQNGTGTPLMYFDGAYRTLQSIPQD